MRGSAGPVRRGLAKATLATTALCLALLALAPAASADYEQVPEHFGVSGEAEQLKKSQAMAINVDGAGGVQAGSIYVVGINNRVVRYSPGSEGEAPAFREAWGWGIGDGAEEFQRCGPAYAAEPRPAGAFASCRPAPTSGQGGNGGEQIGHFSGLVGVAVNRASGEVYVLNARSPNYREHHLIEVFSPTGEPVGEGFGDSANPSSTPPESIEESPEKLHKQGISYQNGIAVDEAGVVYVIDQDFPFVQGIPQRRIMSFEPESPGDYEHYVYAGRAKDIDTGPEESAHRISLVGSNRLVAASGKQIREYPTGGGSTPLCEREVTGGEAVGMAANPDSGEVFFFVEGRISRLRRLGPCDEASGKFEELQAPVVPEPTSNELLALAVNPSLAWGPLRPAGVLYAADTEEHSGTPVQRGIGDVFAPVVGTGEGLTVSKSGGGAGTVTSSPAGIDCGSECEAEFPEGETVTLSATAAEGSTFSGWSGECGSVSGNECEVTMSAARAVTATFEPEGGGSTEFALKTHVEGEGSIECAPPGGGCAAEREYLQGTAVTLTAVAQSGWQFTEWTGACAGTLLSVCEVSVEEETEVGARFDPIPTPEYKLTVAKTGTGSGTVTSSPSGINCGTGASCEHEYEEDTEVTLSQVAASGSEFKEWTGACTGTGTCKVTMSEAKSVTAKFDLIPRSLSVTKAGPGTGEVKCKFNGGSASACTSPQPNGTAVEVIATANAGSTFAGFSAGTGSATACSASPCSFALEANSTLTATFNTVVIPKFKLTVTKSGTGSGTVTSSPSGIACGSGAGCEAEYEEGVEVTLNQSASSGSEFKEWGGACSGSGTCKVTMSAAKAVTAKFDLIPKPNYKLSVSKLGGGTGTITSTPSGINCGATCEHEYEESTEVELHASATTGTFKEWGGACSGSGTCKVTMTAAKSVTAKFTKSYKLSVSKTGTGAGTVTSSPAGINCGTGSGCEHEYEEDTEVTLSQSASTGSEFKEWTGACTGTGACKVTMSEAKSVTAKFDLIPKPNYKLTVSKLGGGTGTITSTPSGINCGATCEHEFEESTEVELHASATTGTFKEWGGACSGSGTCKVTMSAAKSVTAKFTKSYKLSVSKTGTGSGKITSSPAGISCGVSCEAEYEEGTEVTLSPEAATGDEFIEWAGACTGSGACKVTMSSAKSVSARFEPEPPPPPPFLPLTVAKTGSGSGTVTSNPAGIDCGATCSFEFEKATTVELHQEASPGSEFVEWGGACTGSGNCKVKINLAKEVTARFEPQTTPSHTLTIQISGTGSGTVICDGGACAASYPEGTKVTLAALPATGSSFSGWSGACTGTGSCEVTIDSDTTVGASFVSNPEPPASSEAEVSSDRAPFKGNSAQIPLSCPAPGFCTGVLNLYTRLPSTHSRNHRRHAKRHEGRSGRSRLTLIASQAFSLTPGQSATLPVKIANSRARRMLKLGATLVVRVTGTGVKTRVIRLEGQRRARGGRGR